MIDDVDVSTYKSILELNNNEGPYGLQHKVVKEECKNHLHKRMGNRLFALKRSMREKEVAGGKVQFRSTLEMTDNTIKALQRYYLVAVNRHIGGCWKSLKLDIMSTFFHSPARMTTPSMACAAKTGVLYQQDKKANVPIRSHKNMEVAIRCTDPDILQKIHSVYKDLTSQDLLERCLKGRTQNPNESLHSKLWAKCSKSKFSGYDKDLFAAQLTVLQHNFGFEEGSPLPILGIPSSTETKKVEEHLEKRRSTTPKQLKKKRRTAKKGEEDYCSGGF